MSFLTATKAGGANLVAFLDMLARCEGTAGTCNDDGYSKIVNPGGCMTTYADHPRQLIQVNANLKSTAAGRYQLLARFYDAYKASLNLPDFSPGSQDRIALQQIKECKAIPPLLAGDLQTAINLCSNIWASLPGSQYKQPVRSYQQCVTWFVAAGGTINA